MKGDYFRYIAEIATNVERQGNVLNSLEKPIFVLIRFAETTEASKWAYKDGFELAKNELIATNPIRLGLALNFSVFYYEILGDPDAAIRLAKQVCSIEYM